MKPADIQINRMYDEFAHYWPLISAPEDYAAEARHWRQVLRAKLGPGRHEILELGVGGGNNLSHLTADFEATAVDLSEKMLAVFEKLNPGVQHHVGDMRTVRLDRKFRAVLIHDAVNYMLTENDLRAALRTAAAHLDPGGVLVMSPDFTCETFKGPMVRHSTRSDGSVTFTHMEYMHDPDPGDTTMETIFVYLIQENGRLRIEPDRHITNLFPLQTWLDLMEQEGFTAETRDYPVHEQGVQGFLLLGVLR